MQEDYFPVEWDFDECSLDEVSSADGLFLTYDFDLKVDMEGNPHFIVGVMAKLPDGYVYPAYPGAGFYHFTIDKAYLESPGPSQTSTGWNYSKVVNMESSWSWNDSAGNNMWQQLFPSLSISKDNDQIMYVVSSLVNEGSEIDPDNDPCTENSSYDEWNMDGEWIKDGEWIMDGEFIMDAQWSKLARSIQMAHLPCDHMPWGICHVTTCWHVPEHFSAAARLAGACAGMCWHMPGRK